MLFQVVNTLLLISLNPLWAAIFARLILGEHIATRTLIALAGNLSLCLSVYLAGHPSVYLSLHLCMSVCLCTCFVSGQKKH